MTLCHGFRPFRGRARSYTVVDTCRWLGAGRRVGAGLPAKGPVLLANFHPPFTVAAATVFAGKPAPTTVVDTGRWLGTGVVGAGSPAKRPALLANFHPRSPLPPPPYSRVNPLLPRWWTQVGGWAQAVVGAGSPAKRPALLANFHPPFTVAAATVFAGRQMPLLFFLDIGYSSQNCPAEVYRNETKCDRTGFWGEEFRAFSGAPLRCYNPRGADGSRSQGALCGDRS